MPALTGTLQAQGEPKPIVNGKIEGNDFSFKIMDDDSTAILQSGKYYPAGDSISLNIVYKGTKLHTTLKRASQ